MKLQMLDCATSTPLGRPLETRTRRVNHITRWVDLLAVLVARQSRRRARRQLRSNGVELQERAAHVGPGGGKVLRRDQEVECGVVRHVRDAVSWRPRIDRYESRAGLENRQ